MLLGEQELRTLKPEVHLFDYSLKNLKEVVFKVEPKINFTVNNPQYEEDIRKLMIRNVQISISLPFTTTIQATISTHTEETLWTKQYPYPIADNDFVNKEISELLTNGVKAHIIHLYGKFFQDSVEYVGHIIKNNRIILDPKTIEYLKIKYFPDPKTLKELR